MKVFSIHTYFTWKVFGVDYPDELSEDKIKEKYTLNTEKEDQINDGNSADVIPGSLYLH